MRAAVEEAAHYGAFVAVHAHGAGGRAAGDPGRRPVRGARLDARRRRPIAMLADTGTFLGVRPVRRRVGAGARRRRGLARRHDAQDARVDGHRHRGVPQGRRARASGSPTAPTAASTRTSWSRSSSSSYVRLRHVAARGDPLRDRHGGRVHGLGRPRRDAGAGPVRGPRGGRRRPAGGRHACSSGRSSWSRAAGWRSTGAATAEPGRGDAARDRPPRHRGPRPGRRGGRAGARRSASRSPAAGATRRWARYNRLAFLGDTYLELIGVFDRRLVRLVRRRSRSAARRCALLEAGGEGLATYALATRRRGGRRGPPAARPAPRSASRSRAPAAPGRRGGPLDHARSRSSGPSAPPFLIEHEHAGCRVGRRGARAMRGGVPAPGWRPVRLAALELPVADAAAAPREYRRSSGSRSGPGGARQSGRRPSAPTVRRPRRGLDGEPGTAARTSSAGRSRRHVPALDAGPARSVRSDPLSRRPRPGAVRLRVA